MTRLLRIASGTAVALLVLGTAGFFGAGAWLGARIVSAAKARGLEVTVGSVHPGWFELVANDVEVRAPDVPQLTIRAARARISLSGLQPVAINLEEAHTSIEGSVGATADAASALAAHAASSAPPSASTVIEVSIAGDLVWTSVAGPGTELRCEASRLTLKSAGLKDIDATCEGLRVSRGALSLGPWSLHVARDGAGEQGQLAFGPAVSTKAALHFSRTPSDAVHFDAAISKTRPSELGFPPAALALLGMSSDAPLTVAVRYDTSPSPGTGPAHRQVRGRVELETEQLPVGAGRAVPAHLVVDFSGEAGGPLEIATKVAEIGHFSGTLKGRLTTDPLVAQLTFDTQVVSCAEAAKRVAAQAFGGLGQALGSLATALGADRAVGGSVALHADISVDFRVDPPVRITTRTTGDCDLSLFR